MLKSTITNFFTAIMNYGIIEKTRKYEALKIKSFNVLNMCAIFITLINIIYSCFDNSVSNRLSYILPNILPLLLCLILLGMMKLKKVTPAYIIAFTVFPFCICLMTIYLEDRAVMYFQVAFALYAFFFFESYKIVIPISLLIWGYFFVGAYYQIEEHKHTIHRPIQGYEVLSIIGSALLFYFSMFFLKTSIKSYQLKVKSQRTQLEVLNNEIKSSEMQLKEKNEILNKIFSIMSHDLRVPVEGLNMMTKAAKTDEQLLAAIKDILPDFKTELLKMSSIFDNMINWAKLEMNNSSHVLKEVDLNLVVNKVVNQMNYPAANKHIHIERMVQRNLICQSDPNILEIVLRNLTSNAIKFTKEGGKITIKAFLKYNTLYLQVIDTGIGMNADTIKAITAKGFYTSEGTKKELGTGLGLMICSEMIEKQGGKLTINSQPNKGSCINVTVPSIEKFNEDSYSVDEDAWINEALLQTV